MSPQAASRVGVFLLVAMGAGIRPARAQSRTFTVDTTADSVDAAPGDGLCADAGGLCSLRAAVMEASAGGSVAGGRGGGPRGVFKIGQGPPKGMSHKRIQGA